MAFAIGLFIRDNAIHQRVIGNNMIEATLNVSGQFRHNYNQ